MGTSLLELSVGTDFEALKGLRASASAFFVAVWRSQIGVPALYHSSIGSQANLCRTRMFSDPNNNELRSAIFPIFTYCSTRHVIVNILGNILVFVTAVNRMKYYYFVIYRLYIYQTNKGHKKRASIRLCLIAFASSLLRCGAGLLPGAYRALQSNAQSRSVGEFA